MWNYIGSFGIALIQEAYPASTPTPVPPSESGGLGSFVWLIVGIGIGIVIGVVFSRAFGKSQSERLEKEGSELSIYTRPRTPVSPKSVAPHGKRCPACNSTYTDQTLIYCVSDGTSLVSGDNPPGYDPKATIAYREAPQKGVPPT